MPTSGLYQKLFENSEYRNKALDYCAVVIITHCFYSKLLFRLDKATNQETACCELLHITKVTESYDFSFWENTQLYSTLRDCVDTVFCKA